MSTINVTAGSSLSFSQGAPDQRAASASVADLLAFSGATSQLSPLKLTSAALLDLVNSANLTRTVCRPAGCTLNFHQGVLGGVALAGGIHVSASASLAFTQSCLKGRVCTAASRMAFAGSAAGGGCKTAGNQLVFSGIANLNRGRTLSASAQLKFSDAFLCLHL